MANAVDKMAERCASVLKGQDVDEMAALIGDLYDFYEKTVGGRIAYRQKRNDRIKADLQELQELRKIAGKA
jgi:hypothetical protein